MANVWMNSSGPIKLSLSWWQRKGKGNNQDNNNSNIWQEDDQEEREMNKRKMMIEMYEKKEMLDYKKDVKKM